MRIPEWPVLLGAISIAFIASAETLLCATAVDQMHSGPRTKYDRELSAQGVGNMICGLLGVLPMTGVIVRSGANVEAGAETRASAILHGVWLLLFVSALPFTLKYIPLSALAAILVFTGYKLAYPKIVPTLLKYGKRRGAHLLRHHRHDRRHQPARGRAGRARPVAHQAALRLLASRGAQGGAGGQPRRPLSQGAATFIRLPKLAAELEKLKPGANVHVHFDELDYIDHACLDLLRTGTGSTRRPAAA